MHHTKKLSGICPKSVEFDLIDGNVSNVLFEGGCNGNLKGIARLVEGMSASEVQERLAGISCGKNPTSCPDQLSKILATLTNQ